MAQSRRKESRRQLVKRNDAQAQPAPELELRLRDRTEPPVSEARPIARSAAALETIGLGHAGLGNDCWSGASGIGSGSSPSDPASSRMAMQRLRRRPRSRTPFHRVRPLQAAEARFTADSCEILTC
jgi:hypothetical protein